MKFSKAFGAAYDYFMFFLEKFFLKSRRARLLSNVSGRVLEVGVGTGINFEHYSSDVKLTGIEPSPYMMNRAKRKEAICFLFQGISIFLILVVDMEKWK